MSKATEIWDKGIGSVHGADVTQKLCYETASNLAAYARELEKEQSDLDWLEGEVAKLIEPAPTLGETLKEAWTLGQNHGFDRVQKLIRKRKEAKP